MESHSRGKYFQRWDKPDPARISLEKNLALLEKGSFALAFSSGLAVCCAITKLLQSGDHILIADGLYGGSYFLVESIVSTGLWHKFQINDVMLAICEQACYSSLIFLEGNACAPNFRDSCGHF